MKTTINLTGRVYFCSRKYQLDRLLDAGNDPIGVAPNHNNPSRTIYVFKLTHKLIDTLNSIDTDKEYIWLK